MFFECAGSSSITTMPPKPMIESCSPVLPSGRRAMGCVGLAAASRALAAAAAVKALCFRKSRRSMGGILLKGTYEKLNADRNFMQIAFMKIRASPLGVPSSVNQMPSLTVTVRGILFDMDGVLISSTGADERCWLRWAKHHGMEGTFSLQSTHGRRALDTLRI